jgi:hypothetical protein
MKKKEKQNNSKKKLKIKNKTKNYTNLHCDLLISFLKIYHVCSYSCVFFYENCIGIAFHKNVPLRFNYFKTKLYDDHYHSLNIFRMATTCLQFQYSTRSK